MSKVTDILKKEMEEKVSAYVCGYNGHNLKKDELNALKKSAKAGVDAFNQALEKETYRRWAIEGDPVKTAIRLRLIPGCQRVSYKVDDADVMSASYKDAAYKANLPMMHAVLGHEVFADKTWFTKLEKLAYIIANRVNAEMGNKASFSYAISDAAKEFSFPEGSNPACIDNMANALQSVFDSILFIDDGAGANIIKAGIIADLDGNKSCPAWTYIRECMTAEGEKDGQVLIRNTGKMSDLVAGAMHIALTNGDFATRSEDAFVFPEEEKKPEASEEASEAPEEKPMPKGKKTAGKKSSTKK